MKEAIEKRFRFMLAVGWSRNAAIGHIEETFGKDAAKYVSTL